MEPGELEEMEQRIERLMRRSKRRLIVIIFVAVVQLAGCGAQLYWFYRAQDMRHQVEAKTRELKGKIQELSDADRRVREDTERLQKLLKLLPPPPIPDKNDKM